MGGDFGPKMKFAGYDALVITGKAPGPKYLYVSQDDVLIMDAEHLWGLTTVNTQDVLVRKHGQEVSVACIGPAGEHLVRWATIESKTENSFGQGGFGAVMGDKKLKAIVIQPGSWKVPIADPGALIHEITKVNREISPLGVLSGQTELEHGRYVMRRVSPAWSSCTAGRLNDSQGPTCPAAYYSKVPRSYTGEGSFSGHVHCIGGAGGRLCNDQSNFELAVELNKLTCHLGLNQWEAFGSLCFFMKTAYNEGKLSKVLGEKIDKSLMRPETAVRFLRSVARRHEDGDIWAEGVSRAADIMGLSDIAGRIQKHGYGSHWDGRHQQPIHYPVWVVSALSWALAGKDPFNQAHGHVCYYASFVTEWAPSGFGPGKEGCRARNGQPTLPYQRFLEPGARLYGATYPNHGWIDHELGYVDKEYVTLWHENRGIIKSSVPVCDFSFPLIYNVDRPGLVGYIEAEVKLFNAVVGTDWTLEQMHVAADRVQNVLRALLVRQGRTRSDDESVIPYFEQPAAWPAEPASIDTLRFTDLLGRYYALRGWDKETGWPKRQTLERLGLKDIADQLESIGRLP
jgi:aldehyde:ferredoxin oxidoreductase